MRTLRKEVNEALKKINQEWVEAIKIAEQNGQGIDTTEITGNVITYIADLDDKFEEYKERLNKTKKGLFK